MKVIAILQARTSSSRLPNKVLLPILGEPMLARQIERVLRATEITELIVATSNESSDDRIVEVCDMMDVSCFRGDLNDVLDRFYQAGLHARADHIVRLTGDCPLISPDIIDLVIRKHLNSGADYTTNCMPPSFPDGLDVEIAKFSVIKEIWQSAVLPSEREHVTLAILDKKRNYELANFCSKNDLSDHRWTVDEPTDFEFVAEIYARLYQQNNEFDVADILALLESEPRLYHLNSNINRNEGLQKSFSKDREFISGGQ